MGDAAEPNQAPRPQARIFIVGAQYNDDFNFPGANSDEVNTTTLPGGASLLHDMLEKLPGPFTSDFLPFFREGTFRSVINLEGKEVSDISPSPYGVKSRTKLPLEPNQYLPVVYEAAENMLLVLVDQHTNTSCQVSPWYRIYRWNGDQSRTNITLTGELLNTLYENGAIDGWEMLAVVVDADQLRTKELQISRHLSWCQTAEDFVRHFDLSSTEEFPPFLSVPNLVVRFDCDGIIYKSHGQDMNSFDLFYATPENAEGDHIQFTPGATPAIPACFVADMLGILANNQDEFRPAITNAMRSAHVMASRGFVQQEGMPIYFNPFNPRPQLPQITRVQIPRDTIAENINDSWSILGTLVGEDAAAITPCAKDIVQNGYEKTLNNIPIVKFGKLVTADRNEMEGFRAIANLVEEYLQSEQTKPLSIGVFGAPGSGKSFGVKEVVKTVAGRQKNGQKKKELKELVFNLSQFKEYSDLLAAFHTIRDRGIAKEVPMVLFDEFDSRFGTEDLGWLKYFLAPMQDSEFLENGHSRPLGPAIFLFIGGTCSTHKEFSSNLTTQAAKGVKKPDFVSRLKGFVDIQGAHRLRPGDLTYQIRRAILLRSMLERRFDCKAEDQITVDPGVLNALVTVPRFRHGARSMESILSMSRLREKNTLRRSDLPSAEQLNIHVYSDMFTQYYGPNPRCAQEDIAIRIRRENNNPQVVDWSINKAGQILDLINDNGFHLVYQQDQAAQIANQDDEAPGIALARAHYYAVNLHDSNAYLWEAVLEETGNAHTQEIDAIITLLNGINYKVERLPA